MGQIHQTANTVYQPDQAYWPDDLPSFEAFTSIEEGRKHYPEVSAQFWVAMKESDIENPTIIGDTEPMAEVPAAERTGK